MTNKSLQLTTTSPASRLPLIPPPAELRERRRLASVRLHLQSHVWSEQADETSSGIYELSTVSVSQYTMGSLEKNTAPASHSEPAEGSIAGFTAAYF